MKKRNKWLTTIVAIIVMIITFAANTQRANADENKIWASHTYTLSVDSSGNIYLTSNRWLNYTKGTAEEFQAVIDSKGGSWIIDDYIVTNKTDDPHPDNYFKVSEDIFYSGYDTTTHHNTVSLSKDQFDSYFIKGSASDISKYAYSTYVRFYGYSVYHKAYFFSNGKRDGGPFANLDELNGGKATLVSVKDPTTAYYRVYDSGSNTWGQWTAISDSLSKTFYHTDYKSGDKIEYKTESALGIKSNTESYTFPTYTLTLNANGGSVTTSSYTMSYGKTNNNTVNVPTRAGYTFKGWYTAQTGGTQVYDSNGKATKEGTYFNSSNKWSYLGNKTLYAQWTPNTYTLTIDPNGGRIYNGDSTTTSSFNVKFQYDSGRGLGYLTSKGYYGYDNTFGKDYKRSGEIHFFFW